MDSVTEIEETQIQQLSDGQKVNKGKRETGSCGHRQREQVSVSRTLTAALSLGSDKLRTEVLGNTEV